MPPQQPPSPCDEHAPQIVVDAGAAARGSFGPSTYRQQWIPDPAGRPRASIGGAGARNSRWRTRGRPGPRPCRMTFSSVEVNERVDGNYLWLPFTAACGSVGKHLSVEYTVLDVEDPSHRGLLTLSANGATQTAVLGGGSAARLFELDHPSPWSAFIEYLRAGIWHILSGIDHLLFLLSLLLPAVLVRRRNRWEAVPMAGPAFANIVKVVTAF